MAKNKEVKTLDTTTEEKIKEAARVVFYKKGYAATRTRDIAEEAGINLALLNYYFRSKEKLFDMIMLEIVTGFMHTMATILNNENSNLEKKVELVASHYIDFITKEPNIPIFMLSEIRNNSGGLLEKLPIKQLVMNSVFFRQHQEAVAKGKITEPNPLHFLMNLLSLVVFPFIGQPLLQGISGLNETQFNKLMQERKKLIPVWIKAMMKAK
ncbi:TetR/AcrR family transcriptional regulator [Capnocytophaga cynodegmi]|uniref:Transcriptional regulator, TetR family n=1 Tax=Capnocytophaga cynodegmi TaxID=28189 RepID=A0A0B7HK44_9FLAO|nr:TetR/AcrR family transcriptional regulator [Capnocytophaga cynodegmi]CEN39034.1 Transcriptional regulator, TetR family [Capnocytophaga cynodegmi]CEN41112.1 Transcriptional regulator, TetR family [Capnocytophaga cynodegmi]